MKKRDYQFTDSEMETILKGLTNMPWGQVNELIFNIQEQTKPIKKDSKKKKT